MRYEDYKGRIKSGDMLAWSHRGWGSWYDVQVQAVRMFTRSEFSHVGIAWRVSGRIFVLESVTGGVRIFPLSQLLPFYHVTLPGKWTPSAEEFALSKLGQPYSKWQAILAGAGHLTPGVDAAWQCAEYSHEVAKACGVILGDTLTPTALVREAMTHNPLTLVEA